MSTPNPVTDVVDEMIRYLQENRDRIVSIRPMYSERGSTQIVRSNIGFIEHVPDPIIKSVFEIVIDAQPSIRPKPPPSSALSPYDAQGTPLPISNWTHHWPNQGGPHVDNPKVFEGASRMCPDCKGSRTYQPLLGPVEPCQTCK